MTGKLSCAAAPCKSCPYRKDVPSGIWHASEYAKLVRYDEPTWVQPPGLFMCHQKNGRLCAGWVATHGAELLALRLAASKGDVDPAVFDYASPTPVFDSGAEAAAHGLKELDAPGRRAMTTMARLTRKGRLKSENDPRRG
jgi:hypothetical protein